jgi:uncharacterized protein (DUF1499 family)
MTSPTRIRLLPILLVTASLGLTLGCAAQTTLVAGSSKVDDTLACAQSSNCVNTLKGSDLAPLRYVGTPTQGMAALQQVLASFKETSVTRLEPARLQAIFTTTLGFRDEVDFVLNTQTAQIDFRSRSLVGLYDFGKNRSRMAAFSQRFNELSGTTPSADKTPKP